MQAKARSKTAGRSPDLLESAQLSNTNLRNYSFKGGRISLNYFVEQFLPQGIVESNRAISWQLEELGIFRKRGSPAKITVVTG